MTVRGCVSVRSQREESERETEKERAEHGPPGWDGETLRLGTPAETPSEENQESDAVVVVCKVPFVSPLPLLLTSLNGEELIRLVATSLIMLCYAGHLHRR